VMSIRTKVLMGSAALSPFATIAAIVLLPQVTLYYERLVGRRGSDFIIIHFHLSGLVCVWVLLAFGTVISFLNDKRKSGHA